MGDAEANLEAILHEDNAIRHEVLSRVESYQHTLSWAMAVLAGVAYIGVSHWHNAWSR